jgi:hypothetical protein
MTIWSPARGWNAATIALLNFTASNARAPPRRPNLANQGFPVMAQPNVEHSARVNTAALADSGNAATAALQQLTKAYQELATKNAGNLTSAIQALSAVKNPAEFMEVQQRLINHGVQSAVSDSQNIAQLTTAVFTAAFEPVKKQIEAVQKTMKH